MEPRTNERPGRFRLVLQPTIVKIYKVAGMVALTAILVGLLSFLIVNIFYFFDHTWVRPVVLSPSHQKVVEASTQLADAKLRASQLETNKVELETELAELDRQGVATDKFVAEATPLLADGVKTPELAMLRREIDQAELAKSNATGRRASLKQRQLDLAMRVKDQAKVVERLAASPYLRAIEHQVVIAFVPYQNLKNVRPGTNLYGCKWGLVRCSKVGAVTAVIDGEVQDIHPHDEGVQRGVMVEISLTSNWAAGENVLFLGSRPLWML